MVPAHFPEERLTGLAIGQVLTVSANTMLLGVKIHVGSKPLPHVTSDAHVPQL